MDVSRERRNNQPQPIQMYYNTGGAVITPTNNNATAAYEKYGDISDDWGVSPLLDNIMYGVFFCQTPSPHLMRILVKMGMLLPM